MKRESIPFKTLLLTVIVLTIVSAQAPVNYAAVSISPQEKGGGIKPLPTPAPKKATPPKKTTTTTPARTNRAGASKTPARKAEPATAATNPAVEVAFWETIKTSTNPEDFREYLKKYPNGEFAGLARNRLNALETAAKEEAARKEEAKKEEAKREEAKRKVEAEKKLAGTVVRNSIGMDLVYIPAGSFMMGSPTSEIWREENEGPQHQVTVQGFYMGKYEVTQSQWQKVMGTTFREKRDKVSDFYATRAVVGDAYPVSYVSWADAQEFIRKLNAMNDGYTYRLPTEAEWEYAARAGTNTRYYWGDDYTQVFKYANSVDQSYFEKYGGGTGAWRDGYAETSPVGSFQPNAFGLYDMTGNVWELCEDQYHKSYHGAPTDGSAWLIGGEEFGGYKHRVQRGGAWAFTVEAHRSASRVPEQNSNQTGFRLVAVARTQ